MTRWSPLAIAISLGFACGGSEAPEGPSVDGSPFLTATIDGVPWSPDPGDIVAYVAGQVILWARRNAADASRTEILQINFAPPTAFQLGSYDLKGDAAGAGQFNIRIGSGGTPDSFEWFVTHAQHTGVITITGARSADSMVSGVFAFTGEDRTTHLRRYIRGQFRLRYTSIDP